MEIDLAYGAIHGKVETMGGELVSFQDGEGIEYLWQGDPAIWSGRNPILFPIVGALKNGEVDSAKGVCRLPRHGFARHSEFTLAERGGDYVILELRESAETLAQYPYPFLLRVTHQVLKSGFYTAYEVTNTGKDPMPFCIGGHTAYRCPLREGERFEDYSLIFDETEDALSIAVLPGGMLGGYLDEPYLKGTDTIDLRHAIFDKADTLVFDGLRSKSVRLVNRSTGHGVRVEFGQFPMLGIWTMPEKKGPYICVEPWQGCGAHKDEWGGFEYKRHVVKLKPGEKKSLMFTVTVI